MEKDNLKEESRFPRIVGDLIDINSANDNYARNFYCYESRNSKEVAPDRENRSIKQTFACM